MNEYKDEKQLLADIFGYEYTPNPQFVAFNNVLNLIGTKYRIWFCTLCQCVSISHINCPNQGTSCNGGGCDDCNEETELFSKATHWRWQRESEDDMDEKK